MTERSSSRRMHAEYRYIYRPRIACARRRKGKKKKNAPHSVRSSNFYFCRLLAPLNSSDAANKKRRQRKYLLRGNVTFFFLSFFFRQSVPLLATVGDRVNDDAKGKATHRVYFSTGALPFESHADRTVSPITRSVSSRRRSSARPLKNPTVVVKQAGTPSPLTRKISAISRIE